VLVKVLVLSCVHLLNYLRIVDEQYGLESMKESVYLRWILLIEILVVALPPWMSWFLLSAHDFSKSLEVAEHRDHALAEDHPLLGVVPLEVVHTDDPRIEEIGEEANEA
jgi:hypothetical protein